MRKYILILLVVVSGSAIADGNGWVLFNKSGIVGDTYWMPMFRQQNGNIARMGFLLDLNTKQEDNNSGKTYKSVMSTMEYDCANKKMRSIATYAYSENMGEGEEIFSQVTTGKWKPVISGLEMEDEWKLACRKL